MTAPSNLLAIRTQSPCVLQNEYGIATVSCAHLGNLILPTGEITFADPQMKNAEKDISRKTFSEKVNPGTYPFFVYTANDKDGERIAFSEIRFSEKMPMRFIPAKSVFDVMHHHRGHFGYMVHNGRTGFMDSSTYPRTCLAIGERYYEPLDYNHGTSNASDEEGFPCAFCFTQSRSENAVHLSIPSGRYFWYWGIAKDNTKCCLIGDFFTYV